MRMLLRYSTHCLPTNSRSAMRESIHSAPNSLINRSISLVCSSQLELPRLSSIVKSNGNATPLCHSKHEDIDVDLTEFPVGAVKAQNQSYLDWQKRKYHFGDNVKVESISGKKSLQAAQVGISFNTRRHRRRYLVQADRLHNTKGVKNKRKQFYATKFITRPRYSCIIGTILLTLSQSLGVVVTFMEKAVKLFFKVTNFQGLLQGIIN